jgi:hypothetical protein
MSSMWIKIPTVVPPGKEASDVIEVWEESGGGNRKRVDKLVDSPRNFSKCTQAEFTTLLICHDDGGSDCVRYYDTKKKKWVTVCS